MAVGGNDGFRCFSVEIQDVAFAFRVERIELGRLRPQAAVGRGGKPVQGDYGGDADVEVEGAGACRLRQRRLLPAVRRGLGGDGVGVRGHAGGLFCAAGDVGPQVEPFGHIRGVVFCGLAGGFRGRFPRLGRDSGNRFGYERAFPDTRGAVDEFHHRHSGRACADRRVEGDERRIVDYLHSDRPVGHVVVVRKGRAMSWNVWEAVIFDGLFAAVAAIGFAVISNPPRQAVLISALLAAMGHGLRFYLQEYVEISLIPSTFFAAFVIGLFSILFARLIHCPAEVFSFPSLLPMIPGMYAYKTILALIRFMNDEDSEVLQASIVEIFRNGLTTLFVLSVLVIGVTLPLFIFHKQSISMTRFRKRK